MQEALHHSVISFYLFFWSLNAVAEFLCAQASFYYTHLSLAISLESTFSAEILHFYSSERDLKVHLLPRG